MAAAEKKFSERLPPVEALRAWMLLFVDHIATKQIIGPALNSLVGGPSKLYEGSRTQIQGAIDSLVKRAIKNGDIRRDLEPFDLLRALIGVSHVASGPDWQQSARRLVDTLITGSCQSSKPAPKGAADPHPVTYASGIERQFLRDMLRRRSSHSSQLVR